MYRLLFVMTALLTTFAGVEKSDAARFEYQYFGNPLQEVGYSFSPCVICDGTWAPFGGSMMIDEEQLEGGTLRNANVEFYAYYGSDQVGPFEGVHAPSAELSGLLEWTVGMPIPATVFHNISFSTDDQRNIVSWHIDIADGPPDMIISSVYGDSLYTSTTVYKASAGVWSAPSVVVPLPAALPLFLGAIGSLLLITRRRRSI